MTVSTNDQGQQNMWATEPRMYMTKEALDRYGIETHNERAEKLNGRFAMMGFIAAIGAYLTTGQIIPGVL